jgi:uncharacterized cupin superfamily protein
VLRGGGVAVLDGQELPLRQWDVVHCRPRTAHTFVGGPEGLVLFGVGAREHADEGAYVADPVAARFGAAPDRDTDDTREAYERFGPREAVRYGGWLD